MLGGNAARVLGGGPTEAGGDRVERLLTGLNTSLLSRDRGPLGIEFVVDVAPARRKPALVTARAQKGGGIAHDEVSVVAASSV